MCCPHAIQMMVRVPLWIAGSVQCTVTAEDSAGSVFVGEAAMPPSGDLPCHSRSHGIEVLITAYPHCCVARVEKYLLKTQRKIISVLIFPGEGSLGICRRHANDILEEFSVWELRLKHASVSNSNSHLITDAHQT